MTPIFNFCPIAPACARLSYVAIVVHGANSSFAVFHSGLRLVFPPVQSKIASFSSLTLRSQRRSSIVAPAVLLVASPWAHSGLRVLLLWVSRAFALDYPTSQSQCTGQTHRLPLSHRLARLCLSLFYDCFESFKSVSGEFVYSCFFGFS